MQRHIALITDLIKSRIKEYYEDRYRLVCILKIFQKNSQTIRIVSRCCWDTENDNFVDLSFDGGGFTAVCVVYAIQKE